MKLGVCCNDASADEPMAEIASDSEVFKKDFSLR